MSIDWDTEVDVFEVYCEKVKAERPKAILCVTEAGEAWIPKSQISPDSEIWKVGQKDGSLIITEWIAEKKGWT